LAGKTNPFRIFVQILILSALVALAVVILMPVQRAIQGGMLSIRDDLITRLERQIGRKIRYSSISPSLFGSFDVRNVSIMGHDNHPVLTMSRFSVAYSLFDLLRGRVQAIHTVRIDTPYVNLNTARDHDLIEMIKNLNSGADNADSQQDFAALFPDKLMVRIRNGKCVIFDDRDQFGLDALHLNVEIADSRMILDGRWDVGITIDTLIDKPVNLFAIMKVSGSCRTDMEEGEAVLSIPAITGDAMSASPIAFGFSLEDNVLHAGKMPDNLPYDFSLAYQLDDGKMDARFECVNFRLRELFSFSGGLEGARRLLDIAGSGTAFFEREDDGSLGYSVDLAGAAQDTVYPRPQSAMASFEIKVAGDEHYARIDNLRFSIPAAEKSVDAFFFGELRFTGGVALDPIAPEGRLSLRNFSRSGMDGLRADIDINTREGASGREIAITCDELHFGQDGLSAFNAMLRPAENDMGFTVLVYQPNELQPNAGLLTLDGSIHSPSRRVEAFLRLDSFSTGDLAGIILPFAKTTSVPTLLRRQLDKTVVTTEIELVTDFAKISYNAPRFVLSSGTDGFMVIASLSGTERSFILNGSRFIYKEDTLLVSGKVELLDSADLQFSINTIYRDLNYYVEGEALDGKSINIQGSYGLDVSLKASGSGYSGSLRADGFPVPFLGHPAFCSFSARLRYDSVASWSMNLEQFELANIASPAGLAQIRISGSANQNGADFPLLYYRDPLGPLNGRAGVIWETGYSAVNGTIVMGNGAENYHVSGSVTDGRNYFAFTGTSMRLDRAFRGVKAVANGDMRLTWDSSAFIRAECNLYSINGKLYNQEFGATAAAVLDKGDFSARGTFSFADLQGEISSFSINIEEGIFQTLASIQGLAVDIPVEGNFLLTADFKPLRSWLNINEILNSISGKVQVEKYRYGIGGQAQDFDIIFARSGGAVSVSGGPRNMIRFRMDQDGSFYGGLSSPFPVRGTIIGTIDQKSISATCADLYVDLGELFKLVPKTPEFYLTGGYVNASIDIRGSLTDPNFFGTARATSLRIRIPDFVREELRPIPFNVSIDGNEMAFGPVAASVGNGAGTVSGLFFFDRWIPNMFSIDINVPRETPIPYGFDIGGFVARGDAAGKLNVSMENMTFDISGDLYANNTEMGINYDEMVDPINANPFALAKIPFVVDLTVSTGPVVEFSYPSSRFPILRANPDIGTKLRVTADSIAEQFSIISDVRIRSGEIFYFERSFYIRSGVLMFRENELHFDPRLTARAEVRDRSEDGPVTISMIVDNAPLLSFNARFESTPPLSQMEILTLLGQNITGSPLNENTDSAWRTAASSVTDLAAQFYMVRRIEQMVRNFTRLDMFSVRTQVLQNLAFTGVERLIQTPVDRTVSVGNYLDNTTVFGGKYIGQDMFIQGMLSMRYDANKTGGITFAPDFGVELQNPLFSIRWDFIPEHPENWYVNDNSITLSKSFTF